jgi:hypothetical protein
VTATQTLAFPEDNLVGWERALYAFLVEKRRRSGSDRTVQGYSSMLQDFATPRPSCGGMPERASSRRIGGGEK